MFRSEFGTRNKWFHFNTKGPFCSGMFFFVFLKKNTFPCYQKEHLFRNNSSQITHKEPNCSARNSERGTIGSTLTLKDHLVPECFFYKKTRSLVFKKNTFLGTTVLKSRIKDQIVRLGIRNAEQLVPL